LYSIDSRNIKENDIFIPLKGENFDGHSFIPELIKRKIKVLDVSLPTFASHHRATKIKATVIAITGSSGKTTLKDMLHQILSSKYKVHSTFENQNNEVGAPLTILNAPNDADFIIVEMGMRHKGDIHFLTNIIKPDITLITNIGVAHLELMGTQRNIALGKSEIFDFPKVKNTKYTAFLNTNIDYFELVKNKALRNGFQLNTITEDDPLNSSAKLATALAQQYNFTEKEITKIFSGLKAISPHREQEIKWKENIIIDDAYNANPNSMAFSINKTKSKYPGKKLITVFGEMKELGKQEDRFHKELVNMVIADTQIEKAFFYGNTYLRIEKKNDKCYYCTDKSLIPKKIKEISPKNKVILFKGSRSTKMETIIKELIIND
jgi:UDP-N-acetylmuramoyl-tripeptide--D-alanyl-D-alanine ligase